MGDGTTYNSAEPKHAYHNTGSFIISLNAKHRNKNNVASKDLTVGELTFNTVEVDIGNMLFHNDLWFCSLRKHHNYTFFTSYSSHEFSNGKLTFMYPADKDTLVDLDTVFIEINGWVDSVNLNPLYKGYYTLDQVSSSNLTISPSNTITNAGSFPRVTMLYEIK